MSHNYVQVKMWVRFLIRMCHNHNLPSNSLNSNALQFYNASSCIKIYMHMEMQWYNYIKYDSSYIYIYMDYVLPLLKCMCVWVRVKNLLSFIICTQRGGAVYAMLHIKYKIHRKKSHPCIHTHAYILYPTPMKITELYFHLFSRELRSNSDARGIVYTRECGKCTTEHFDWKSWVERMRCPLWTAHYAGCCRSSGKAGKLGKIT